MKLNTKKIAYFQRVIIDGASIKFGWYESGRPFIARDNELLSYDEAYGIFILPGVYTVDHSFYIGNKRYYRNKSGIVNYLIDKYCK